MFRSIFLRDWKKSPAHLLLLSQFLQPADPEEFYEKEEWKAVLKEHPQKAIRRMMDHHLLVEGNLADLMHAKYKILQLKDLLAQRHLPVTGPKDQLISRLILADAEGIQKITCGIQIYKCSEKGQQTARQFLDQEKVRKAITETQVMKALQDQNFHKACKVMAAFESSQVFPRGDNKDWTRYDPELDEARLRIIFSKTPDILISLSNEKLEFLRILAGMMLLWGTNTPDKWLAREVVTGIPLDTVSAIRVLLTTGYNGVFLQELQKTGYIGPVKVYGENDDLMCEECKKLASHEFPLDHAPELPYQKCTSKAGCRCHYQPVVNVEIFGNKLPEILNKK
jgi:hypothetical protein